MKLVKNNSFITKNNGMTRIRPLIFDIGMCLIYTLLILLGTFNSLATITAFLLIVVVFYSISLENIVTQMMFLMSFAVLFKMGPSSTSLFTIIEFYAVVLMFWRRPSLNPKEILWLVALISSVLIGLAIHKTPQALYLIKFFVALLLVMGFKTTDWQKELHNYIIMFMLGLIISSAIAYFSTDLFRVDSYIIRDYVIDSDWRGHYYTDTVRFSGLNADPNYYSINLYIAITGVLVLDNKGVFKDRIFVYLGIAVLFFFGLQTVSKSFALMMFAVIIYAFVICLKNNRFGLFAFLLISVSIFVFFAYMGKIGVVNKMVDRILDSFNEGDFTTGRTRLWNLYFDFLNRNPILIPFGAGLGANIGGLVASHNTYVEIICSLGIVGTLLFICYISVLFANPNRIQKRRFENYSILLIILVMYFFLSMLTWVDLPLHLFLCYCFLNYRIDNIKMR